MGSLIQPCLRSITGLDYSPEYMHREKLTGEKEKPWRCHFSLLNLLMLEILEFGRRRFGTEAKVSKLILS